MTYIHASSRTVSGQNRICTVRPMFYVGRVSLMFMMLMFIAVLGVVYLMNFNSNATQGYELTKLEYERQTLLNEREQKNLNLSRSQSLGQIKNSMVASRMIHAGEVVFYDGETAIALR